LVFNITTINSVLVIKKIEKYLPIIVIHNLMSYLMKASDFDKIEESNRFMLENAYNAITVAEGWDFMKNFSEESFMFSSSPMTGKIMNKMEELGYLGHSGCSFGWTMRWMEFLAKHGKDEFLAKFV